MEVWPIGPHKPWRATAQGDELNSQPIEHIQLGVGRQLGIEDQFFGISPSPFLPKLDEAEDLIVLLALAQFAVSVTGAIRQLYSVKNDRLGMTFKPANRANPSSSTTLMTCPCGAVPNLKARSDRMAEPGGIISEPGNPDFLRMRSRGIEASSGRKRNRPPNLVRTEALTQAINYVETIESRQGLKIACLEEIAYHMRFITAEQVERLAAKIPNNSGYHLQAIVREASADPLRNRAHRWSRRSQFDKHFLVGRLLQGMETAWTITQLIQLLFPGILPTMLCLFFIVGL